MTAQQYSRLEPFLYRLGDKSVIIVYLLSFLSPIDIKGVACTWLRDHDSGIPYIDTTISNFLLQFQGKGKPCFSFSNGRPYSAKDIEKILIRAFASGSMSYQSIPQFQSYIGGSGQ